MATDRTSEIELLARVRCGDRDACEQLVRDNYERIYSFLVHETLNPHLAADLTQETFAAAWQAIGGFNGRASVRTWLHQIAYRKFLDALRKSQRQTIAQRRLRREWTEPTAHTPLHRIIANEDTKHLYEAIQGLGDKQRDVIVMRYLQGMKVVEVAAVMGEPLGTTKWRTSEALQQLRSALTKDVLHGTRE